MRIARRSLLASSAALLAAPALLRAARADAPPIVLKLHHFMSSVSSAHDKFIVPWARKVQAESGGRLRIDIFPSMQLGGTPAHLFDQARDGDAEIVWTTPALTPGRFPKIEMFDLPFVPSRRALVGSKALADFAPLHLKDEFREVRPLCFSCSDRGVMHANAPIRTVEDIKDLKIHVQTPWAGEALRQLGAKPVPMPPGQLQTAITQHVIDGCLDPWHLMPGYRLNDTLKMHTEFYDLSPSSTTFVLAMNSAAYERLPRDLKAVIDSNSGQVAASMAGAMWDLEAASVADAVTRGGDTIITLLPEAVAHWRKLTEPVVEKWLKDMKEQKTDGGRLLAAAHALMQKYAKEPEPQPPQPPQQPAPQQDAVAQPAQSASPSPQGVPQQGLPQQAPQANITPQTTTPQIPQANIAPKFTAHAPATTAAPPPPSAWSTQPMNMQVNAPAHAQWPKPAPLHAAKPPAPHVAAPAQIPSVHVAPPAPPATGSIAPAAPTPPVAAAPVPPAAPAPPVATVVPAAKPAAALAPLPQPPPAASPVQAPPAQAAPVHVAPAPKSLDIPL